MYDQAENESDEAYMYRMMDEVWAYLQSPVAQKLWEQKQGGSRVRNFVNAVREFFKTLLNFKGKNIDDATLENLLLSGANELIKRKYLESKEVAEKESKAGFSIESGKTLSILEQKKFLIGKPVATLTGNEFTKSEIDLVTQVESYYKQEFDGKIVVNGIGEVLLDRKGINDSVAHGIGRSKASAFIAVPDILTKGIIIDQQDNWKGRGYNTFSISAPIEINGEQHIGVVIVKQTKGLDGKNRFYVHEVLLTKNLQDGFSYKTGKFPNTRTTKRDIVKLLNNIFNAEINKQLDSGIQEIINK